MDTTYLKTQIALLRLEQSIQDWDCYASGGITPQEFIGGHECPLCIEFRSKSQPITCYGCPIFNSTGKTNCDGTPHDAWCNDNNWDNVEDEIEFLVSLLPSKHPWRII